MATVILTAKGIGDRPFNIEYAQNILNVGAKHPPKTWALNDPGYELVNGVIIIKETAPAKPELPKQETVKQTTNTINTNGAINTGTNTTVTESSEK